MRATLLVGLYGLCVAAVLTFYAVYEWLAPMTVMLIAAAAVILPTVVIVYGLEEDARPPKPNLLIWAQSLLVMALFGLAVPGVWHVADARAKALSAFGTLKSVDAALSDEAPQVQQAACELLFSDRLGAHSGEITDVLARHPASASQCLKVGAGSEAVGRVTRQLTLSWHESLMSGGDCAMAAPLNELPIASSSRAALLLDCALRGTAETRGCCATQLKATMGADLHEQVSKGRDLVIELGTSGVLLAAAFGEETSAPAVSGIAAQLGLTDARFQRLALETACSAATNGASRPADIQLLEWLFAEHEACLETEGVTNVVAACEELLDRGLEQRPDLGRAICEANQKTRKETLERAAAFKTGVNFGDNADAIDSGRAAVQADALAPENFEELMKSGEFKNLSDDQRMALIESFQQKGSVSDKHGFSEGEARQRNALAQTKEGRAKLEKQNQEKMAEDTADAEKVLGFSMDELRDSIGEDGEVSDEMKERLEELEKKEEK